MSPYIAFNLVNISELVNLAQTILISVDKDKLISGYSFVLFSLIDYYEKIIVIKL